MIYLDDAELTIVKDILNKHLPNTEVWVFGSRAKGNVKPYSDLDLCIKTDNPLSFTELALLKEAFSGSDLPMRVDIVEWLTITPEFQEVIKQKFEKI